MSSSPAVSVVAPLRGKLSNLWSMLEFGLTLVVVAWGVVLSIYGYYDAAAGRPNAFLNFDNLIDGVATPMSYYAIMAVGLTMVILTGYV